MIASWKIPRIVKIWLTCVKMEFHCVKHMLLGVKSKPALPVSSLLMREDFVLGCLWLVRKRLIIFNFSCENPRWTDKVLNVVHLPLWIIYHQNNFIRRQQGGLACCWKLKLTEEFFSDLRNCKCYRKSWNRDSHITSDQTASAWACWCNLNTTFWKFPTIYLE